MVLKGCESSSTHFLFVKIVDFSDIDRLLKVDLSSLQRLHNRGEVPNNAVEHQVNAVAPILLKSESFQNVTSIGEASKAILPELRSSGDATNLSSLRRVSDDVAADGDEGLDAGEA